MLDITDYLRRCGVGGMLNGGLTLAQQINGAGYIGGVNKSGQIDNVRNSTNGERLYHNRLCRATAHLSRLVTRRLELAQQWAGSLSQ